MSYLTDVYGILNRFNCSLQNEDSNIFSATSQISSFKQKLQTIKKEVETNNFSSFKILHEFMSTSNLEIQVTNLNEELGNLMESHLNLLLSNFENYFPKQQAQELESKPWILNPFGSRQPPDEIGLELKSDHVQKAFFNPGKHTEFWIKQLDGNYRDLVIQALDILVQNPTTYLAEKGFSALVDIKKKEKQSFKWNIRSVDARGT